MKINRLYKCEDCYNVSFKNDWLSLYHIYINIDKIIIFDAFEDEYEYTCDNVTENSHENVKFLLSMTLQERNNYFENLLIIDKFNL